MDVQELAARCHAFSVSYNDHKLVYEPVEVYLRDLAERCRRALHKVKQITLKWWLLILFGSCAFTPIPLLRFC